MSKNRIYNYSDEDAMMASEIIAGNFKIHLPELSTIRTNWTAEYADSLELRISDAIDNYLGIDAKKDLRKATGNLLNKTGPAKRDLSFFKTQVDTDFRDEPAKRKEFLNTLGFTKYLKAVQNENQEALIKLLYAFKTNMTDELKLEISSKGMNPVLIDNIMGYAPTVKIANVSQETFKGTTKEITKEVTDMFNGIYKEIIGICKTAADYYQFEPLKKALFTFRKVVKNMNAGK